jgi:uncharacterized protein (TIGR04255 family)
MGNSRPKLPDFDNPPVIEKVLGVQFQPIAGISYGHYGWFWKTSLDDTWIKAQDAPFVIDQFEKFGDPLAWGVPEPKISFGAGQDRVMLINRDDDRIIQLQSTRFLYNWKKQKADNRSFFEIYLEFQGHFQSFADFLKAAGLELVSQNQWELTYVNHVPKGELWESPSDWPGVFPGLFGFIPSPSANVALESMSGSWRFEIPPKRGRIHITFQHAKTLDHDEVLVLSLTARGPLTPEADGWNLSDSMEIGHEALVRTFVDVSSPAALAHWGAR